MVFLQRATWGKFSLFSLLLFFFSVPLKAQSNPSQLLLITLDTLRADTMGCPPPRCAATPHLDGLTSIGLEYTSAISPVPLTLPAHASLLTGLSPLGHGVHLNGTQALAPDALTLAEVLQSRGWTTAAVVGSRVLDHRFGLHQGFDTYDDRMGAENLGQYGYAERTAKEVVDRALAWWAQKPKGPFFLWLHFYDPHAPYLGESPNSPVLRRYLDEIERVDRALGRFLAETGIDASNTLVAVVGDHGEAFGEHGEEGHGVLLHGESLRVPLRISGPGLSGNQAIAQPVAIARLPSTLLQQLGLSVVPFPGPPLPLNQAEKAPPPVYSETEMPWAVYGWSRLQSITLGSWKLIRSPRPELYDLNADPLEKTNLVDQQRREARRLEKALRSFEKKANNPSVTSLAPTAELSASLRSLGYLDVPTPEKESSIDPKDGLVWLGEFQELKRRAEANPSPATIQALRRLTAKSPNNMIFLKGLASAELAAGNGEAALKTLNEALELAPDLDFLYRLLGEVFTQLKRPQEAEKAWRHALLLNPRFAEVYFRMAEAAYRRGDPEGERELLETALREGVESGTLYFRLGQIEAGRGNRERAVELLKKAVALVPNLELARRELARVQRELGREKSPAIP